MLKLTHKHYRLPSIEALSYRGIMDTGTTAPLNVLGVDTTTGVKGQFVVKLRGGPRMSEKSLRRELLVVWIAHELDIQCVEPVLVHISQQFVDTFHGKDGYMAAVKSLGINYGSVFMAGYQNVPNTGFKLEPTMLDEAKRIFMFDMLISNADRVNPGMKKAGKPNVFSNGEHIMVYDHELAFTFVDLLSFAKNKTPWIMGVHEVEMYRNHYFYPLLKADLHDFSVHTELLTRLNTHFWNQVTHWMPQEWQSEELEVIRGHLDSIIDHRQTFSDQLTQILAS